MFLLKNNLDKNQIFPIVFSKLFSKLCYFIWKSAKTGLKKKYVNRERKLKFAFFHGNYKSIKIKE